jgi:hypothetical protein
MKSSKLIQPVAITVEFRSVPCNDMIDDIDCLRAWMTLMSLDDTGNSSFAPSNLIFQELSAKESVIFI